MTRRNQNFEEITDQNVNFILISFEIIIFSLEYFTNQSFLVNCLQPTKNIIKIPLKSINFNKTKSFEHLILLFKTSCDFELWNPIQNSSSAKKILNGEF